ncbi:hypothetical protein [Kocuria varians]|uniref:hypothetical protein n=1 Tax=Kocuria varians TaxID=1272 RepID=UPI000A4D1515|nr:hypothetical protein [Kocuria varians]
MNRPSGFLYVSVSSYVASLLSGLADVVAPSLLPGADDAAAPPSEPAGLGYWEPWDPVELCDAAPEFSAEGVPPPHPVTANAPIRAHAASHVFVLVVFAIAKRLARTFGRGNEPPGVSSSRDDA